MVGNAKYKKCNANAPWILSSSPKPVSPLAPTNTCRKIALLQQKSFKQIGEIFGQFIPSKLLKPEQAGDMSRQRLFSKENTFWAFFSQVLDADGGCKEVIRKLQSYASIRGIKIPSSSTASYYTASKKFNEQAKAYSRFSANTNSSLPRCRRTQLSPF